MKKPSSESSEESIQNPRVTRSELFANLRKDRRISNGAFRLYCFLYSHLNLSRGDSYVWPGYRSMQEDFGCSMQSINGWLQEMQSAGWIRIILGYTEESDPVKKGGQRPGNKYELLDGKGIGLTEAISKRVSRSGNGSVSKSGNAVERNQKWKRSVSKNRNESFPKVEAEVIPPKGGNKKEPHLESDGCSSTVSDNPIASLDGSSPSLGRAEPSASDFQKGGNGCTDKF